MELDVSRIVHINLYLFTDIVISKHLENISN